MPRLAQPYKKRQQRQTKRATRSSERELARYIQGETYTPLRTGRSRKFGTSGKQEQPFPDPPLTWEGTLPEWACYWALNTLGLRERNEFEYQSFFDAGIIFDFFIFDLQLAIEIQGLFWHYEFGGGFQTQYDQERKVRAEAVGITLIYIDEDNILESPIYYTKEALAGRDHSRATRGF